MAVGFRKSLFGYNADDVINYVKKLHNSFSEKEAIFKSQIDNLNVKIADLSRKEEELEKEKNELNLKLDEYNAKKVEMERLSEKIGKLYLVAQTNAKNIMSNAEQNSKITDEEIRRNISAIDETHMALENLKNSIRETSENFNNEVNALINSLKSAKAKINNDADKNLKSSEEFSALLETINK